MGGTEVALRPEVSGTYTPRSQPLQQCCFSRSVGAGKQDEFARSQLEGDVPDEKAVTVADSWDLNLKDRRMYIFDYQVFIK